MQYKTLVLSPNYQPISLFPNAHWILAKDAVTRVYNGIEPTCRIVAEYDTFIKTPNHDIKWPAVIARIKNDHDNMKATLSAETLYYRDHAVCAYCNQKLTLKTDRRNSITMDHVYPRSKGGRSVWNNLVASCPSCNHTKSNALPEGKWKPRFKAYKPTYWQLLKSRRKFPIKVYHESWLDFIGNWDAEVILVA